MNDKCNYFSYIDLYTYLCTTFKTKTKKEKNEGIVLCYIYCYTSIQK